MCKRPIQLTLSSISDTRIHTIGYLLVLCLMSNFSGGIVHPIIFLTFVPHIGTILMLGGVFLLGI